MPDSYMGIGLDAKKLEGKAPLLVVQFMKTKLDPGQNERQQLDHFGLYKQLGIDTPTLKYSNSTEVIELLYSLLSANGALF